MCDCVWTKAIRVNIIDINLGLNTLITCKVTDYLLIKPKKICQIKVNKWIEHRLSCGKMNVDATLIDVSW